MRKWTFLIIFFISVVILGFYLVINIKADSGFTNMLIKKGWFPRITAWALLLIGAYGLGRSRFSFLLTAVFFLLAFFFAYIGPYIPILKNYY